MALTDSAVDRARKAPRIIYDERQPHSNGTSALSRRPAAAVAILWGSLSACDRPATKPTAAADSTNQQSTAAPATSSVAASSRIKGRIAFVSERHGNREIYLIDAAGGALKRLTTSPEADHLGPASPAGGQLLSVATREAGGAHREQLVLIDGDARRAIGPSSGRVRHPSWLPDGKALIFEADTRGFRDLYRLDLANGATKRLTDSKGGCFEPAVSPAGDAVVFAASMSDGAEIMRLDLRNRELTRLTWSRGDDTNPAWSPDGHSIAFLSARDAVPRLHLMQADGSKPRAASKSEATTDPTDAGIIGHRDIAWSPDGRIIAFVEQRQGRAGLRLLRLSDGSIVGRSDGAWIDEMPSWSPDGKHLVFVSSRSGDPELYRLRRDGGELTRLTNSKGPDWLPRWLPQ